MLKETLIVDDNQDILDLLSDILRRPKGYEVAAFTPAYNIPGPALQV